MRRRSTGDVLPIRRLRQSDRGAVLRELEGRAIQRAAGCGIGFVDRDIIELASDSDDLAHARRAGDHLDEHELLPRAVIRLIPTQIDTAHIADRGGEIQADFAADEGGRRGDGQGVVAPARVAADRYTGLVGRDRVSVGGRHIQRGDELVTNKRPLREER
ncbi:hypothetical protein SDC9_179899 [bioreactor metagenome]|uniref:Uncharacterized protein n=1 Tax=bioreactor metagenome TaxID=1076179 RepID=A0A645H043_9ZZZZ